MVRSPSPISFGANTAANFPAAGVLASSRPPIASATVENRPVRLETDCACHREIISRMDAIPRTGAAYINRPITETPRHAIHIPCRRRLPRVDPCNLCAPQFPSESDKVACTRRVQAVIRPC